MTEAGGERPSPDALLDEAKREHRGKLKIFLGAAPGVGKTYSMLSAAQQRHKDGIDVAIGLVETHHRRETEAMIENLEIIPRLDLEYRGIVLPELNLDAVLSRKPKLVLIDELAHTNTPGARHPKRYMDVEEILEAGIDVYTTLNVQHIESLNDIVTRITGVTVRETVPDRILQMADALELIDLPPDELLQRLKEGKVYIPEQARLAMGRFFTPGNLTALRELALRQAAERVDDQMAHYMRLHAISGPWPASQRVMVCLADDGQASSLVRMASKSAERRQAPWMAVHVIRENASDDDKAIPPDIATAMQLADSLGGDTAILISSNPAEEILRLARERNVSNIIVGQTTRSGWSRFFRPSVALCLTNLGQGFDIVVAGSLEAKKTASRVKHVNQNQGLAIPKWGDFLKATTVVALSTSIAYGASVALSATSLALIYLIAILLIVTDRGFLISLYGCILSFIALDYFMARKEESFLPERWEDFVTLIFFLVVSIAISIIGNRLHKQIGVTRRNAERTQMLYDFTKTVTSAGTIEDIARATVQHIADAIQARVALFWPKDGQLETLAASPEELRLDTVSNAAIDWAWRHGKPAGHLSDTLPGAGFFGMPLKSSEGTLGVLAIRRENGEDLTSDQKHLLASATDQLSVALERARLHNDIEHARLQSETEKLRSSLLSSISHDLRTPLLGILGASQSLNENWTQFTEDIRRNLVGLIAKDAARLDRLVQNLLDMTRIVSGGLTLNRQSSDIRSVVENALSRLSSITHDRTINLKIPAQRLPIDADAITKVLVNVIENACSYSTVVDPIDIETKNEAGFMVITVTDRGPGIPLSERERVFDMFYRLKAEINVPGGVGLGLSICRGLVEAHGGQIIATTGQDNIGTSIIIRLPLTQRIDKAA